MLRAFTWGQGYTRWALGDNGKKIKMRLVWGQVHHSSFWHMKKIIASIPWKDGEGIIEKSCLGTQTKKQYLAFSRNKVVTPHYWLWSSYYRWGSNGPVLWLKGDMPSFFDNLLQISIFLFTKCAKILLKREANLSEVSLKLLTKCSHPILTQALLNTVTSALSRPPKWTQ